MEPVLNHEGQQIVAQDRAFRIETQGTDIIDPSMRHGKPGELFFVWFAAVLNYTNVMPGVLFITLGLNVWQSILAALICSLSFSALGYASTTGPKAGTVTLTVSKAAFGVRGNKLPALFSWITSVGWESVGMVLTVWALLTLAQYVGLPSTGVGPTIVALIITLVLTYTVPVLGHATLVTMQRLLAFVLAICAIILVFAVIRHVHLGYVLPAKDMAAHGVFPTLLLAISIGLANTFFGWANYAADYSRYLPVKTSKGRIVGATFAGGGIASFLMMVVGVLLGTFINSSAYAANPVMTIAKSVPSWAAIPFLLTVIVGDITANYLNSYSSGMSFLSIGIRMPRYLAVLVDGLLCTALGVYALFFSPNFMNAFENFLSLMIMVMGPWATIYLVHHKLIKGNYDPNGLADNQPGSRYWYTGGINWRAMVSFVVGIAATFMTINGPLWASPVTKSWFGNADVSAFAAPIVTGIVYFLLAGRKSPAKVSMPGQAALD